MTEACTAVPEEAGRIVEEHGKCWTFLDGAYEADVASEAAG